jgi:mono/diheme cytochrome c family protein
VSSNECAVGVWLDLKWRVPVGKRHLLIAVAVVMGIVLSLQGNALAETLPERGTYLMRSIVACGTCHTLKDAKGDLPGMDLAGGFRIKGPVFNLVLRNITPDKETGIGAWTDKQIIRAIQEGIRANGKIIGPPMPIEFYRSMSDRDVKAIVAYLRQVKPIRNEEEDSVWKIPLPQSYGPPVGSVPEVPRMRGVSRHLKPHQHTLCKRLNKVYVL